MALAITEAYRVRMALTFFLGAGALILALLRAVVGAGCRSTELALFPSPSTRLKAVVYERDCGAPADATTNVSLLVAADSSLPETGNALVVAGPAGRGFRNGPEVRVAWGGDTLLLVRYSQGDRVVSSATRVHGVAIAPSPID
jgi:hypothetical protein